MLVYRIGKNKYAKDLTGEGSKRYPGRWNQNGVPCIYTGASKSLCLLEFSVHTSLDTIPGSLVFTTLEIPDREVKKIKLSELPANWNGWPHPKASRDFGTNLLRKNADLIIRFPSAIIPDEFIYVINPLHQNIKQVKIISEEDYDYDIRLKK